MCYNVKASLEAQLRRAKENGDADLIAQITEQMEKYEVNDYHHTNGFEHKPFLIYEKENQLSISKWGLIPHWVRSEEEKEQIWNKTLNARGESIWEKPSFRESAKHSRCLICVDGFYEYHHFKKKNYPFFIQDKMHNGLTMGGLSSKWVDQTTGEEISSFTIVTTKGNNLLGKLHNNPKLKEPRMPLILDKEEQEIWLLDDDQAPNLIYPHELDFEIHSVGKLSGKDYLGNTAEVSNEKVYPELEFEGVYDPPENWTLF